MRGWQIPGVLAPRWQKKFNAFAADHRGLAAVEFAMIAVPFFFLIFGLLEICMIFIMSSILEHAANEVARDIRTGQFQAGSFTQTDFKNSICDQLFGLMSCGTELAIDARVFSDFAGTSADPPMTGTGELDKSALSFSAGAQNDIVVVRVFYEWNLIVPILSKPLSNLPADRRLLQATVAFRNEPFGNSGGGTPSP